MAKKAKKKKAPKKLSQRELVNELLSFEHLDEITLVSKDSPAKECVFEYIRQISKPERASDDMVARIVFHGLAQLEAEAWQLRQDLYRSCSSNGHPVL